MFYYYIVCLITCSLCSYIWLTTCHFSSTIWKNTLPGCYISNSLTRLYSAPHIVTDDSAFVWKTFMYITATLHKNNIHSHNCIKILTVSNLLLFFEVPITCWSSIYIQVYQCNYQYMKINNLSFNSLQNPLIAGIPSLVTYIYILYYMLEEN